MLSERPAADGPIVLDSIHVMCSEEAHPPIESRLPRDGESGRLEGDGCEGPVSLRVMDVLEHWLWPWLHRSVDILEAIELCTSSG